MVVEGFQCTKPIKELYRIVGDGGGEPQNIGDMLGAAYTSYEGPKLNY